MEISLIWVCAVAAALIGIAFVTALGATFRGQAGKAAGTALVLLACIGLLLVCGTLTAFAALVDRAPAIAITSAIILIGAAAVVVIGRRRPGPGLPPRAKSWPRARLGLLFLALLVVLVTSARNARLSARQAFDARRAELVSLEQLWWPGIPASLNAAPLYARAYQQLSPLDRVPGAHEAFESFWSKPGAPSTLITSPALLEWTRRNQGALALAVEGTERAGYASVEDALWRSNPFGAGRTAKIFRLESGRVGHDPSTIDNQLSRRRLGDLLQTRSLQRAYAGQSGPAIQDANALLSLAEQTSSPWLRPGELVERLLAVPGITAEALAQLHIPAGEGLDVHLQRYLIRREHQDLELGGKFDLRGFTGWSVPKSERRVHDPLDDAFVFANEILWSEAWSERTVASYDGVWKAVYAAIPQRIAQLREQIDPNNSTKSRWVIEGLIFSIADEARHDCTQVSVAVARYRLQHGQFPASLSALVPDYLAQVPLDPFDGAPLRYRPSANEAHVYSVGPDLKDDGGAPINWSVNGGIDAKGDLVFTVPVPAARP